jgi:hypothetical protein
VAKGCQFVQQIFSECHTVEKGQRPSPNGQAPTFETIAKTPGMTAIALTAMLRTPHRNMPKYHHRRRRSQERRGLCPEPAIKADADVRSGAAELAPIVSKVNMNCNLWGIR